MFWPPILMLCSVTEDSSFGGAAGLASAGLSAGLASLSCARAVMASAVMDKASAGSTLRFFTRIIFLSSHRLVCDLAKLRFYLFPRNPGLLCSTAEEQNVFIGRGGMQKNSGAVIDDPVRTGLLEFGIARRSAQCNDTCSRGFAGPDACGSILNDNALARGHAQHLRPFQIGLGVRLAMLHIGRGDQMLRPRQSRCGDAHVCQRPRAGSHDRPAF